VKVGILAGGIGSRLSEETILKPKPMVEIGGRPILWHIMMHYSHFGFDEFAIALGYKGEFIKKYMADLWLYNRDFMVDVSSGSVQVQPGQEQNWKVHLVDTGQSTIQTKRAKARLISTGNRIRSSILLPKTITKGMDHLTCKPPEITEKSCF